MSVLLEGELAKVLKYDRQQLQFCIKPTYYTFKDSVLRRLLQRPRIANGSMAVRTMVRTENTRIYLCGYVKWQRNSNGKFVVFDHKLKNVFPGDYENDR